jgi:hypothetical protein
MPLHDPLVGGSGQSASFVQAFVQMYTCWIIWHES